MDQIKYSYKEMLQYDYRIDNSFCGWKNGKYLERGINKVKKEKVNKLLRTYTFQEQNEPLDGDNATVGRFIYYLGDHFIIPIKRAITFEIEMKITNRLRHKLNIAPVINEIKMGAFEVGPNSPTVIRFDMALSRRIFDLTFTSMERERLTIELDSISLKPKEMNSDHSSKTNVFIASDSTAQTYRKNERPQFGWGEYLAYFLSKSKRIQIRRNTNMGYPQATDYITDELCIHNFAIGGRSSKSFIMEGKLQKLLLQVKKNDYLLIQWGDNDATRERPMRYVEPERFKKFLEEYIVAALDRGAIPILITPPARYNFTEYKEATISFNDYRKSMIDISERMNIKMIDLGLLSTNKLNEYGSFKSRLIFMKLPLFQYDNYPDGLEDNTHLQEFGAKCYAEIVATELNKFLKVSVGEIIKEETRLSAEVKDINQIQGISLNWDDNKEADFYIVQRFNKNNGKLEKQFITNRNFYFDVVEGVHKFNYKYKLFITVNNISSEANDVAVQGMFLRSKGGTKVIGINLYEVDTKAVQGKISFSIRFNSNKGINSYKILMIDSVVGQTVVLDKIDALKISELHSYSVNEGKDWKIQVQGITKDNKIIAKSALISLRSKI